MQTHVQHNWRYISTRSTPNSDELTEAVTPQILIDRDVDEKRARYRLIAIDGISAGDGGKSSDLNASTGVADNDNGLFCMGQNSQRLLIGLTYTHPPIPVILISKSNNKITQDCNKNIWNHSRQTHLGFSNTFVLAGRAH